MMPRSGTELLHPFQLLERIGCKERLRVADMGCGALGHFVFPAAELVGPKGKVYAVDILRDALDIIRHRAADAGLENITCVWSDIDVYGAAPIPSGSVDVMLLVNNLFLSKNRQALVQELARLTKPGGTLLVVDWNARQPASPSVYLGPTAEHRISREEALAVFRIPEFSLQEEFAAGPFHYGLVFRRTDVAHRSPHMRR